MSGKRGPGQPQIGRKIQVTFPDWGIAEADRRAAALSTAGRRFSRAHVIRTWVAEALEQKKHEK